MGSSRVKDIHMLEALERIRNELTDAEAQAFAGMRQSLDRGRRSLTPKQRDWVEAVYRRHELDCDEPAENLASSGKVTVTDAERRDLQKWTESLGARPLRPPGSGR